MGSRKDRMTIHEVDGVTVLNLGPVEIWDGADLALLRDTFTRLIQRERRRRIGVDMSTVQYVPSGFFGMLFDWHERGIAMHLYAPRPRVSNMLWFRQFFDHVTNGTYLLQSEPKELLVFDDSCDWGEEEALVAGPQPSIAE
jgi:hypothetical protein